MINAFIKPFGNPLAGMPAWPVFETLVGIILIVGARTTGRRPGPGRGRPTADAITGEAVIG